MAKDQPAVLDAFGLPTIIVVYPCGECGHGHEDHEGTCRANVESGKDDGPVACGCPLYTGGLAPGIPRAVQLRQLSALEWTTVSKDRSLPILLGGVKLETVAEEEKVKHYEWIRACVRMAVTHCRWLKAGKPYWQEVRVLESGKTPNRDAWELTIDELDRQGRFLLARCIASLIRDLNDGGPFGGVVRSFRNGGSGDVAPAGGDVREDAARVAAGAS